MAKKAVVKITQTRNFDNSLGANVSVDGIEEMIAAFGALPNEVERVARRVVTGLAAKVRTRARQLAPKAEAQYVRYYGKKGSKTPVTMKPGTLRRGIKSKGVKSRSRKGLYWGEVYVDHGTRDTKDAFHWRFVEYGTEKMPARPFIKPAADEIDRRIEFEMASEVEKQVLKEFKKRAVRAAKRAA